MNYKKNFVLALLLVSSILFMSVDTSVFAAGEPVVLEEIRFICEKDKEQLRSDFVIIPDTKVGTYRKKDFNEINGDKNIYVSDCHFQIEYQPGLWDPNQKETFDANFKYRLFMQVICKKEGYRIGDNTKIIVNGEEINGIERVVSNVEGGTTIRFFFNEQVVRTGIDRPNPSVRSFVYDGSEKVFAQDSDKYTVSGNKATDAGAYKAVFKVKDNYAWKQIKENDVIKEKFSKDDIVIEWEIIKAQGDDPAYTAPTDLKGKKGSKLSTVALPEGFEWKDPNQVLDATGEKEFKAIYKSKNYVDKEVDLKVTVEEAPEPEPTPNPPEPTPNPPLPPAPSPDSYDNYENDTDYSKTYEHKARRHKANAKLDKDVDREDEETINKDTSLKERSIILAVGSKLMTVFGKNVTNDTAPIIKNNRTMLPARFVAEGLGSRVTWNAKERTVYISGVNIKTNEPLEIKLTVGSKHALVNGKAYELDSPVIIENDRTYTPLRFIAEILGAEVYWDDATKVVRIIK